MLAMTVIDILIIVLMGWFSWSFWGKRDANRFDHATVLALVGVGSVALFYVADLTTMWVLPALTERQTAMQMMEFLRLNVSWIVALISMPCIVTSLLLMRAALSDQLAREREEASRQRSMLSALPDGLLIINTAGTIRVANAIAMEWFGDKAGTGQSALPLLQLKGRPITAADLKPGQRRGLTAIGVQNRFPAEVRITSLDATTFALVIVDVTETRILELEARQAQKVETLGEVVGGIIHNFNTNLTVILGQVALLTERVIDPQSEKSAREIRRAAERSSHLVSRLLSFSHKQHVEPELLDLNEVLQRIDTFMQSLLDDHITLHVVPFAGLGLVSSDRGHLEHAIVNLISNARDAIGGDGTVTIQTGQEKRAGGTENEETWITLSVSDTGCGMTQSVVDHAFEPFFTTKPRGKGTGLGLPTIQGLIRQSNGEIEIDSEVDVGTTVTMKFPLAEAAPSTEAPRSEDTATEQTKTNPSVLVAEDDQGLQRFLTEALAFHNYEVIAASSVTDALQSFNGSVDVLLTDMLMQDGTGVELAAQLREKQPELPVVLMTGLIEDDLQQIDLDPDIRLLRKPFGIPQLLEALEGNLPPAASAPHS